MFQYVWYNKASYQEPTKVIKPISDKYWLGLDDIEHFRMSYWAEHCLECAAPLCYNTCDNWVERCDGRCRLFHYGIYDDKKFSTFPYHATLKFRKWGKLESYLFPGTVNPKLAKQFDCINRLSSSMMAPVFHILKAFSLERKLGNLLENLPVAFARRFKRNNNTVTNVFLFQTYSEQETPFQLCIDIISDHKQIYREKIVVATGYSQTILDLREKIDLTSLIDQSASEPLVRIYPENDYEAEFTILFAGFVKLKREIAIHKPIIAKEPAAKVKCVAWDLDNTVWNGTLIESRPEELQLRAHVLDTIQMLDARGIIQTVVSKNYEAEATAVLKRLGIDHYFVYTAINWESKSSNLEHLAKLLNINIDTFALIDDSVFERNEVSSKFSCVRVYDENILSKLNLLAEFNVPVTAESKRRREMYQIELLRNSIKKEYEGDNVKFLEDCNIQIKIMQPNTEQIISRCYELVQRTNQLNLSGRKYEKESFLRYVADHIDQSFVVFCEDKFGNYGQIAFLVTDLQDDVLTVVEFAMSCRVAGKYVESALVEWLRNQYGNVGIKSIVFQGVNSGKNRLLIESLQKIGMENVACQSDVLVLKLDANTRPLNCDIVSIVDETIESKP